MGKVEKILEVAESWLNYLGKKSNAQLEDFTANDGSGNYTIFWRDLKPEWQGQPWCAAFVVWCARQAGVGEDVLPAIYSCSQFSLDDGSSKFFRNVYQITQRYR
jgi:hypothetical protein